MDFIEIGEAKYASEELMNLATSNLFELGINSVESIDIHAPSNCITIGFGDPEDAHAAHAIARRVPSPGTRVFRSQDAVKFLLELNSVVNSWGHDR